MVTERFYQEQGQSVEKKPADVRFLEGWKWVDKAQIVGGVAMLFFPPTVVLGLGLIASAPVEIAVKNRYINWRMNKKHSQNRFSAPLAA